jgi:hypothetical protein
MNVTEHFTTGELACRCGCSAGESPDDYSVELLGLIEDVRQILDRPLHPNSGARCVQHNEDEGGSVASAHITTDIKKCEAVDISAPTGEDKIDIVIAAVISSALPVISPEAKREIFAATKDRLRGIGLGSNFVHIDVNQGRSSAWGYKK